MYGSLVAAHPVSARNTADHAALDSNFPSPFPIQGSCLGIDEVEALPVTDFRSVSDTPRVLSELWTRELEAGTQPAPPAGARVSAQLRWSAHGFGGSE